jgi:hypothetical protein
LRNARLLCASPAVVKRFGMPKSPHDLAQLSCIVLHEDKEPASLRHFRKG